jgi:YggT family protein
MQPRGGRLTASAGHLGLAVQGVKDSRPRHGEGFALTPARQRAYQVPRFASGIRAPPIRGCTQMNPFLWLIHTLIWLYIYVLIAAAVMSWLLAFNVVNAHNSTVRAIWDFLYRVTEPGLRPIRAILPNLGGIDISPVILIIGLMFLDQLIVWLYVQIFA